MTLLPSSDSRRERGFSLVELLVVTGIIALIAAVSIPMISSYIRNYKIRAAAQQIASQMQTARSKAIMKNVNLGVIWLALNGTNSGSSTWAVEDDLQPGTGASTDWSTTGGENFANILADRAQSPGFVDLPDAVVFDNPSSAACGGVAANTWGVRIGHLGGICQVGSTSPPCPTPGGASSYANLVAFSAGNATVCLLDRRTNLRRRVTITSGGRTLVQ